MMVQSEVVGRYEDEARKIEEASSDIVARVRSLPDSIANEVRARPFAAIGVASLAAFGAGVLTGSRVARFLALAFGGYVVGEEIRRRLRAD